MRHALVAVIAMLALAACTEGSGGPGAAPSARAGGPAAAVPCKMTVPTLALADAIIGIDAIIAADADIGSDAGSGSDAGTGSDAGPGSDAGTGSDAGMSCKGLDLIESMISLVPGGSGTGHVQSIPGFTDQMVSASITGAGFVFTTPGCGPQQCTFAPAQALPFTLTIACTATDGQPHTGSLLVQGAQGMADIDTASLDCAGSPSTPLINVAPSAIDAGDVPVSAASTHAFTVTNNGTAALTFSISLPAGAPAWTATAPGSACIAPAQCTVAPGGGVSTIGLRFSPTTHGTSTGTISITSNAGPRSVDLTGRGVGARVTVTEPTDLDLDFGIIPRNQAASRSIVVTATGNRSLGISASAPGAPFSVTPMERTLTPGMPETFLVSCSSPTATGAVERTIDLSAPEAYAGQSAQITTHCEVANTQVSLAPQLDLGEVRRGDAPRMLPFTITNPGPLDAVIGAVELSGAPGSLAMSISGTFPRPLPAGQTISGRLTLATDEDIDLAAPAPKLKISVDGEQLAYPVTGKVTTPAAYVTPEKLELGTACIGSAVTATVSMINSGTARLLMEPPQLSPTFTLELQSPASYPAPLLAGTTATIGVAPAAQQPGAVSGTLTWAVDAPRAPFVIPVSLSFIETGTAISPASLGFSTVKVNEISLRYTVTLQNCSSAPVTVSVEGVASVRGGAAAWKVEPSADERSLAPQDKLTISVAFAPLRHGRHVAELQLGVDGERRIVTLEGDGIDLDFKRTSFYACGCSTPRVRTGWPIALAVALAVLRRRRRPRRA